MEFTLTQSAGVRVFQLKGKLNAGSTEAFERAVLAEVDAGATRILFDMTQLEFISSPGLRVFAIINRRLGGEGRIAFCGFQPDVQRVFEVVGMARPTQVFTDSTAALAVLSPAKK
jgi:anti-sigma B factor antagonist